MKQLARGVNALPSGPYNTALEHLEIAGKADTSPKSAAGHLAEAQNSYADAFGNLRNVNPLQSAPSVQVGEFLGLFQDRCVWPDTPG